MTIKNGYDQQTADELAATRRSLADDVARQVMQGLSPDERAALDKARRALRHDEDKVIHDDGIVRIARLKEEAQARRFTREEVLTVLRSKKAEMHPESHSAELIDRLVRIFERME